ncbi:MAG: hypothetical protein ACFB51_08940 [Anaerolineae bacterium]
MMKRIMLPLLVTLLVAACGGGGTSDPISEAPDTNTAPAEERPTLVEPVATATPPQGPPTETPEPVMPGFPEVRVATQEGGSPDDDEEEEEEDDTEAGDEGALGPFELVSPVDIDGAAGIGALAGEPVIFAGDAAFSLAGDPVAEGAPADVVGAGADGTLIAADGETVALWDGEAWTAYTLDDLGMTAPAEGELRFEVFDLDGQIAAASCAIVEVTPVGGTGIAFFDGSGWQRGLIGDQCVRGLSLADGGVLWVSALGEEPLLFQIDGITYNSFQFPDLPEGAPSFGGAADIAVPGDGTVWPELEVCSDEGCTYQRYRLDTESLTYEAVDFTTDAPTILRLAGGEGYIFTADGIYQLNGLDAPELIAEVTVIDVVQNAAGAIWVLADDGDTIGVWQLAP